jgi:hypothetical protein
MKINIYSRRIEYPEEYMTKKVKCCTLFFFLCEFLLEGFSHKVFNETTCAIQSTNAMYSFLRELFFPTRFLFGVFNEACAYRGKRPRGSVVKYTDSNLEGKEGKS